MSLGGTRMHSSGRSALDAHATYAMRPSVRRLVTLPVVVLSLALIGSCQSDGGTMTAPGDFSVRFVATNDLIAPITLSVDGQPYAILTTGRSAGLNVSSKSKLTWTSAKPADAHGQPIPDQIGEVNVAVSAINAVLEITNVIADQTYITASIFNHTTTPVSIGVFDGSTVSCASQLPASEQGAVGFTQTGYYRLVATTQFRAYGSPDCTGAYVAWPSSQLTSFEAKSGLVTLTLLSAP